MRTSAGLAASLRHVSDGKPDALCPAERGGTTMRRLSLPRGRRLRLSLPRGRRLIILVAVVVLVLAGLSAVVGLLRQGGSGASSSSHRAESSAGASGAVFGPVKDLGAPTPMPATSAGQGTSNSSGSATTIDINAAIPPDHGRFLVRNGELDLLLARGTLDRTVQQVTALTNVFGGYILSSAIGQLPPGQTPYPIRENTASGVAQQGIATTPSVVPVSGGTPYAWMTIAFPPSASTRPSRASSSSAKSRSSPRRRKTSPARW